MKKLQTPTAVINIQSGLPYLEKCQHILSRDKFLSYETH
uniref:Uncharacterized protein n=1 Tax=Rhizophora mucronata TaxID=61149 RepID=A0A2P2JIZ8_RHIMU